MIAQPFLPGMEDVAAQDPSTLTRCRRVYDALLWFARSSRDRTCYPRQETIAEYLGYSLRTVSLAISELARAGMIEITRRARAAYYRVLSWMPGSKPRVMKRGSGATVRATPQGHSAAPDCASDCASGAVVPLVLKTHEKTMARPDGVFTHGRAGSRTPAHRPPSVFPANLTPQDLRDPIRMHGILQDVAKAAGRPGLADNPVVQVRWHGLIRRALRVARNPAGCFRQLWRGARWGWISQADEDGARSDIARARYGDELKRHRKRDAVEEVLGGYDG